MYPAAVAALITTTTTALLLLRSRGYTPFYLGYTLYAKTSLGKFLHRRQMSTSKPNLNARRLMVETPRALIRIVPFMKDNFAYLVICKQTGEAMAIDAADPGALLRAWGEEKAVCKRLVALASTHYHADHAGGNEDLVRAFHGDLRVIGGGEAVDCKTETFAQGEEFLVGELRVQVREVPAHTMGSIALYLPTEHCLFTGDFLFSAGCGKFFEGNARDFCQSLRRLFEALREDTQIFPGHDYTRSNLEFARGVDPNNSAIATSLSSPPSPLAPVTTLAKEREINLFVQAGTPGLLTRALLTRIAQLVDNNPNLSVQCGSDAFQAETRRVVVNLDCGDPAMECEQAVRALRSMKDLGARVKL